MDQYRITYKGFCTLGGLNHPRTMTQATYLGNHYMYTAYYLLLEMKNES